MDGATSPVGVTSGPAVRGFRPSRAYSSSMSHKPVSPVLLFGYRVATLHGFATCIAVNRRRAQARSEPAVTARHHQQVYVNLARLDACLELEAIRQQPPHRRVHPGSRRLATSHRIHLETGVGRPVRRVHDLRGSLLMLRLKDSRPPVCTIGAVASLETGNHRRRAGSSSAASRCSRPTALPAAGRRPAAWKHCPRRRGRRRADPDGGRLERGLPRRDRGRERKQHQNPRRDPVHCTILNGTDAVIRSHATRIVPPVGVTSENHHIN